MIKNIILIFVIITLSSCINNQIDEKVIDEGVKVESLSEKDKKYGDLLNSLEYKEIYNKVDNLEISDVIDLNEFTASNLKGGERILEDLNPSIVFNQEIKIDLYNNDFLINALKTNDELLCDNINIVDDFGDIKYSQYCKGKYFLYKMIEENDIGYCNKFGNNLDFGYLIGSEQGNKKVCEKLFKLNNIENISDKDISDYVTDIQGSYDENTFLTLKTLLLNKNFCNDIDVINMKITCYIGLYNDEFYTHFENDIYPDLLKTPFLHEEND